MGKKIIKLAVVDDQQLFRQGLLSLIKEYKEFDVIIEAANGKEFVEALKKKRPDVVLLDVEMPEMDGAEVTEYMNAKYPSVKIVILTMHDDDELVFHLAKKGAHGFLLKDSDIETVSDAIYTVMDDKHYFREDIAEKLLEGITRNGKSIGLPGLADKTLSDREIGVLRLICKEHTTREISEILGVSYKTVEGHRERIFQKTGARNIAGIVKYAIRYKLLE